MLWIPLLFFCALRDGGTSEPLAARKVSNRGHRGLFARFLVKVQLFSTQSCNHDDGTLPTQTIPQVKKNTVN